MADPRADAAVAGAAGKKVHLGPVSAPVLPLALVLAGAYLTWFAVHYWGRGGWPTTPVKSVLQGNGLPPRGASATVTNAQLDADLQAAVSGANAASASGGSGGTTLTSVTSATGSAISDDAMKYQGQGYVYGGPADKPGDWDCSSFVSYVLGKDLGMQLPGGGRYGDTGYPPHSHGPTTVQYLLFGSAVSYGQEKAGDLLVTSEHIGICIGGGKMISAQDPQLGTGVAGYQSGFPGGTPFVRRV